MHSGSDCSELKAVLASDLDAGPWCFVLGGVYFNYEIVSGFLRVFPIRPKGESWLEPLNTDVINKLVSSS